MRAHVLLAVAGACLLAVMRPSLVAADAQDAAAQEAMKQMEGTWEIVSITRDGKKVSPPGEARMHFIVRDGHWSVKKGDETIEGGTLKIDPSTTPKQIDVTPTSGKHKDQTLHGIYELRGDRARDCFALAPGGQRPKSFSAPEGSGNRLTVYRRLKP